jgi:hypothetical protein
MYSSSTVYYGDQALMFTLMAAERSEREHEWPGTWCLRCSSETVTSPHCAKTASNQDEQRKRASCILSFRPLHERLALRCHFASCLTSHTQHAVHVAPAWHVPDGTPALCLRAALAQPGRVYTASVHTARRPHALRAAAERRTRCAAWAQAGRRRRLVWMYQLVSAGDVAKMYPRHCGGDVAAQSPLVSTSCRM